MNLQSLDYQYPEELIATEPQKKSRVLLNQNGDNSELSLTALIDCFESGDLLVLNDSKVVKRRLFVKVRGKENKKELEVLFIEEKDNKEWVVLFPASRIKDSDVLLLPGGVEAQLVQRGIPQKLKLSQNLDFDYFATHGELPLPPYIQKARGERHQATEDDSWYQTVWAKKEGSAAAPTASLHFSEEHLRALKQKGVKISYLTLHVGLGTFLPIQVENLLEHQMHKEWIEIGAETLSEIEKTKQQSKKVWALGTTVARSLESFASGLLKEQESGSFVGESDLFIYPGYEYKIVDVLMTNFHQPKTTLLALVAAFSSLENVKTAYQYAIDKAFKLFSYGDLSVWMKK